MSEEALQIAEKRREMKGKGEGEKYTHLNAEFQRTARTDKKAFLSDQCKEIEENNRMGKTRNLFFKKIRDTKGTFHAKMGTIKDRNGMELTEAEDIKKRWQEYTELYKKDLHDPNNYDSVITHLEPDILECEVKRALGSITTKLVEVMKFQLLLLLSHVSRVGLCATPKMAAHQAPVLGILQAKTLEWVAISFSSA